MDAKITEKRWSKELEASIVEKWKNENKYAFKKTGKPVYSIDTPPPYVNSPVHIGHASTYVVMDMIARYKRMTGHDVLFPLGMDRNGLPIEMEVEKKFKKTPMNTSREEFLEYCHRVLESTSSESVSTFYLEGISFNNWETGSEIGDAYETDSAEYRGLTQSTFIDLYKRGLIYEDERVNIFSPGVQSTIADSEVEYKEKPTLFNNVKFIVKETSEEIIIGTTRPEFLYSCGMVIYNPEDDRYKHLEGKTAVVPISGLEVPIKAHPQASIDKGTGLVMMCSFGDTADVRFFREQGLKPRILIGIDGTMNEKAGDLAGLFVNQARRKIIEQLQEKELITDQKEVIHRQPICERSKRPIEFVAMKEWYLKQVEFKDEMRRIANDITFYAPESKKILTTWIDTVAIDWPISRRRFYATEIPLWYQDKKVAVAPVGDYVQPWKNDPPANAEVFEDGNLIGTVADIGGDWTGEDRVLDTWFDSSNTPLYILGKGRDDKFFNENSPCSLRPQGKEIVRTWLYYTLLKDYLIANKTIFKDVWVHQHIVDDKGYKMSKSKGNGIDPKQVLDKYGAEALRLWVAVEGNLEKTDFRCSFERIEGAAKSLTKLWNVARFITMFGEMSGEYELQPIDNWILREMDEIVKFANEKYAVYDFHNPTTKLRNFLWETFASNYVELVKRRAYNEDGAFSKESQQGALYALNMVLKCMLEVLAPINPMICEKLYSDLFDEDVHAQSFPTSVGFKDVEFSRDDLMEANAAVWKFKKDNFIPLKEGVAKVSLPCNLQGVIADFKAMHSISEVVEGDLHVE